MKGKVLLRKTAVIAAAAATLKAKGQVLPATEHMPLTEEPPEYRSKKLKPRLVLKLNRRWEAGSGRLAYHSSHSSHSSHASHSSHVSGAYGNGDDGDGGGIGILPVILAGGAVVYGAYSYGKSKKK